MLSAILSAVYILLVKGVNNPGKVADEQDCDKGEDIDDHVGGDIIRAGSFAKFDESIYNIAEDFINTHPFICLNTLKIGSGIMPCQTYLKYHWDN